MINDRSGTPRFGRKTNNKIDASYLKKKKEDKENLGDIQEPFATTRLKKINYTLVEEEGQ